MNKREIFDFLCDSSENNPKEWMDEHREQYHETKGICLEEIQLILDRLSKHDPQMKLIKPKKSYKKSQ